MKATSLNYKAVPQVKLSFSVPELKKRVQITCSRDVFTFAHPFYTDFMEHHEEMWALLLNRANRVIGMVPMGAGTVSGTVANDMALYQGMILSNCKQCILIHNHPSENLRPSPEDTTLTDRVNAICKLHGFTLMEHLIITSYGYYSFADEGLI